MPEQHLLARVASGRCGGSGVAGTGVSRAPGFTVAGHRIAGDGARTCTAGNNIDCHCVRPDDGGHTAAQRRTADPASELCQQRTIQGTAGQYSRLPSLSGGRAFARRQCPASYRDPPGCAVEQGPGRAANARPLWRTVPDGTRIIRRCSIGHHDHAFFTPALRAARVMNFMNSFVGAHWLRSMLLLAVVAAAAFPDTLRGAEEKWQLAMNNAELRDIVEEISSILGTTVVLDPRVSGRVTVMSRQALDREGVRRLFYSVLDAHNFTVIDEGDRILITPVSEAKTRAGIGSAKNTTASQFVTQVIELNTSSANDIAGLVRPLVSVNGYVGPSVSANALVITDTAANAQRIAHVVRQLDSGQSSMHAVVQLRHA